jgi:glucose-6-phosphate-specific signal transduction histidine kinase
MTTGGQPSLPFNARSRQQRHQTPKAKTIRLRLAQNTEQLVLTITSDGKPFRKPRSSDGMGLKACVTAPSALGQR